MGGPGTKFEAVLFKWISSPNQISDVHNHKRCSIRYSSVSIIRAAKVCSGQPGCVTTGACAASTWTCWTILTSLLLYGSDSFHSKKCCSSPSKECCSMCLQHQAWNQWHCRILKIGQNFENGAKFWKWGKILKIGQNFENWAKFRKLCKILKIGQNVENRAQF